MKGNGKLPGAIIQFSVITLLAIAAYFVVNFSREAVAGYQLQQVEHELEQDVGRLESDVETLEQRKEWITSDAFIEKVARDWLRKVKAGDVLVIPQPVGGPEETLPPISTEAEDVEAKIEKQPTWRQWWDLFFDESPDTGVFTP